MSPDSQVVFIASDCDIHHLTSYPSDATITREAKLGQYMAHVATHYTVDELVSVCIARQVADGDVLAQGIATPLVMAGYLLAKHTHAVEEVRLLREVIDPLGIRRLETMSGAARKRALREILASEELSAAQALAQPQISIGGDL